MEDGKLGLQLMGWTLYQPNITSLCFTSSTWERNHTPVCQGYTGGSLAKPVTKELITVDLLEAIVSDAERSGRLTDHRLATACLLSFSGFLWFDE